MKLLIIFAFFQISLAYPPCDSIHHQPASCKTNLYPFYYIIPTYDLITLYNQNDQITTTLAYFKSQKFSSAISTIFTLNSMKKIKTDVGKYNVRPEELIQELLGRFGMESWTTEDNNLEGDLKDVIEQAKLFVPYKKINDKAIHSFFQDGLYKSLYCDVYNLDVDEFLSDVYLNDELVGLTEDLTRLNVDVKHTLEFIKSLFVGHQEFEYCS